jgi:hypothetical protein
MQMGKAAEQHEKVDLLIESFLIFSVKLRNVSKVWELSSQTLGITQQDVKRNAAKPELIESRNVSSRRVCSFYITKESKRVIRAGIHIHTHMGRDEKCWMGICCRRSQPMTRWRHITHAGSMESSSLILLPVKIISNFY